MTGRSRVKTSGETSLNGDIAPLVPTTASELKKFEPIMLPSVSSFCPRRAEAMADASSGNEVPAAMTVSPIRGGRYRRSSPRSCFSRTSQRARRPMHLSGTARRSVSRLCLFRRFQRLAAVRITWSSTIGTNPAGSRSMSMDLNVLTSSESLEGRRRESRATRGVARPRRTCRRVLYIVKPLHEIPDVVRQLGLLWQSVNYRL